MLGPTYVKHVKFRRRRQKTRGAGYPPREEADEVLLLAILYIEYHVPEFVRKTGPDRERFLSITNANS